MLRCDWTIATAASAVAFVANQNQYHLLVSNGGGGTYTVCAEDGACGEVVVER